jgi:ribosomal protein S12 methylthiotransferase accessory factor
VTRQAALLRTAANFRHGIVLPPEEVESTPADVRGIVNVGVPANSEDPFARATGGIGWERAEAERAAVGEALERYAAATFPLPERRRSEVPESDRLDADAFSLYTEEQRARPEFPHGALYEADIGYTNMFSLLDNREVWIPAALVALGRTDVAVATSTGLAAGPTAYLALLRAVQEVVERDALAVTWLHAVPGRRVELPEAYEVAVGGLGGEAICMDATPAYSPHPVALVAGHIPLRGDPRFALGAACRETWGQAVEKAFLEWVQGISFAGFYVEVQPGLEVKPASALKTFDDHAVYFTLHPEEWEDLPLLRGAYIVRSDGDVAPASTRESLGQLAGSLARKGIRLFYRDLTTSDLAAVGVCAVRVLSPDLVPLACDEEWRFLGGTVSDVGRRYPWAAEAELSFPNPHPHPLG